MKADIKFFLVIIILIISTKIANANSEIKIGLLAPFSGEFKNIGDSVYDSARIALNRINNNKQYFRHFITYKLIISF